MRVALLSSLACPNCRSSLETKIEELVCEACFSRYPVVSGVPRLLPSEQLGEEWEQKQDLGRIEYERGEDTNVDELARRFAQFAELHGLVLDIGCGISSRPAYFSDDPDCTYVGVDPLVGAVVRDFDFVQGIAERLPFADATFDGVISATMLDHVPDPEQVLIDARRVLKTGGRLALWVGVVDGQTLKETVLYPLGIPARRPIRELVRRYGLSGTLSRAARHLVLNRARALVARLRLRFRRSSVVADVYLDRARYHFRFFETNEVVPLVTQCGFRILKSDNVVAGTSGKSLFLIAEAVD